ncbi:unnamed protein product [Mesocestoides corti]|uniref:Uncharacterized protein n=1 Tax=Mesocestoides corti TaxID=53468 RepID=A0A0R3UHD0_MESCO|nr:unnamed protein product [Mesocestoides corti]
MTGLVKPKPPIAILHYPVLAFRQWRHSEGWTASLSFVRCRRIKHLMAPSPTQSLLVSHFFHLVVFEHASKRVMRASLPAVR